MATQHAQITDAGALLVGISVDTVGQNAALQAKLRLPFPLLSDPGGTGAIKPYDVWHPEPEIARPAIVVVTPDGQVAVRAVGSDFADRMSEPELLERLRALGLPPVSQPPPTPGTPEPGERAVRLEALTPYLRGAKFAARALSGRVPEAAEQAGRLMDEYDRYLAALADRR